MAKVRSVRIRVIAEMVRGDSPVCEYTEQFEINTPGEPEHLPMVGHIQEAVRVFRGDVDHHVTMAHLEKKSPPRR